MQGFNVTIFAYGQTGSGKTHTMFSANWEERMKKEQEKERQGKSKSGKKEEIHPQTVITDGKNKK